jgi:hypothetical protein
MTRPFLFNRKCPKCGTEVVASTAFSLWLRALPHPFTSATYDNENLDYIWFAYKAGWLITLEEKTRNGSSSPAQRDTHGVIAQMLALSSGKEIETMRGRRKIDYRGHYIIQFENTSPDDGEIKINGVVASVEGLKALLSSGVLP